LLTPGRSAGKTRRYSDADLAVLRRIQSLSERGLNLAGIERVLELERQLVEAQAQVSVLAQQLDGERRAHRDALVQAHRSTRAEMVLVRPSETALVPLVRPVTQNRRR
jgi:MerR family transcriptional regulator/heat shock protein HspR